MEKETKQDRLEDYKENIKELLKEIESNTKIMITAETNILNATKNLIEITEN